MKEGFVYIWYDRKRKMYYIGCHWGTVNDGYICSSKRMRDNYRNRPQDFKRRIIKTGIQRESLLEEEYKWLQLIPDRELGKQYYNHSKKHFGHWTAGDNQISIREKMSKAKKGKPNLFCKGKPLSEEHKRKLRENHVGTKGKKWSNETKEKIGSKNREKNKGKIHTEEAKKKISEAVKKRWQKQKENNIFHL